MTNEPSSPILNNQESVSSDSLPTPPNSAAVKQSSKKPLFIIGGAVILLVLVVVSLFLFRSVDIPIADNSSSIDQGSSVQTEPTNAVPISPQYPAYEAAGIMRNGQFVTTDADGDSYPDWIETNIQTNPQVFECSEYLNECGIGTDFANQKPDRQNIIIVLDSSGSMAATKDGKTRMQLAKEAVLEYATQFEGTTVDVGLVVYGHKGNNSTAGKAESCAGIDTIYPAGTFAKGQFASALDSFQPTGWTPIAKSLEAAQAELKRTPGATTENSAILLVTDGEETCEGDPVATATAIRQSGLQVVVDVVALGTDAKTNQVLKPIADAGGGVFIAVEDERTLKKKLYEEFKVAQKQNAEVISCSGTVIKQWTQCRSDMQDKFYDYVQSISTSDENYTSSGLGKFLMSFDKNSPGVTERYNAQTIQGQNMAAEVQKKAAQKSLNNANQYQP